MKKKIPGDSWTEDQYRDYIFSILARSSTAELSRRLNIARAYEYFYGKSENRGYSNLLTLHETSLNQGTTPFVKLNLDNISPKVKLLIGELIQRGFEVNVKARNKEALKRKRAYAAQMNYLRNMQQTFQKAAEFTGVAYGINNNLPKTDEDFEDYMSRYKDFYEKIMEGALQEYTIDTMYPYVRPTYFLDLLCANEAHQVLEFKNGVPHCRRVNPLNCIHDMMSEDNFRRDATYFLEARYISIPECLTYYNIPADRMKEMIEGYRTGSWQGWNGSNASVNQRFFTMFSPFDKRGGSTWQSTGYTHVLIFSALWLDTEDKIQKTTYDPRGNMHVHEFEGYDKSAKLSGKEKQDERNELVAKRIQVVRRATLVAGDILTEYGKTGNYLRPYKNPERCLLPVTSLILDYNNMDSVSLVQRLAGIQDFFDYIMTKMQVAITTEIQGAVAVDISQIPDFYGGKDPSKTVQDFIQTLKTYKIAVIDRSQNQNGFNVNQGTPIEQLSFNVRSTIQETITLAAFLQQQMDTISGINQARMGAVAPRQLSSTTQIGINQSSAITESLFTSFEGWESLSFKKLSMAIAMVMDNNPEYREEMAARLGEMELPDDFSFNDYEATIRLNPISRNDLIQFVQMAVAQGNLAIQDGLLIIDESQDNLRGAINKFIKLTEKREQMMMAMQQQQLEAQMAQAQAQQQANLQGQMAVAQTKGQFDVQKSQVISDGDVLAKRLELAQKDRSSEMTNEMNRLNVIDQIRAKLAGEQEQED